MNPLESAKAAPTLDKTAPENALQTRDEWLRLAALGTQLGLWQWNEVTKELFWDAKTREVFGVSLEGGATLETFYQALHPDDRERVQTIWRYELEGGLPYDLEYRSLWPDGSIRWIHARGNGYYDTAGKPLGMVGVVFDITDQKALERERMVREQASLKDRLRLATIVESSHDAIISEDLDGMIESWNTSAEQMFGFTEAEAIGQSCSIIAPPGQEEEQRTMLRKLRDGERIANLETIRVTKTGKKLDVSLTLSPIRNTEGKIVGASKIIRDITEHKQAERALSRMNQKLIEAQENERTRIGRELHDDVAQRVAVVAVQLERIRDEFPDLVPELRAYVEMIQTLAVGIAKDVHGLSRELHSAKLDYLGIASAAKAFCTELSHYQTVEIDFRSYDLPDSLSNHKSLCLYRVMQESLQNAVKHSGVRRFEVRLWGDGAAVHLTVSDLGIGFERERALHGPGLGLTNMRERMNMVNGSMAIDSQLGRGTTIRAWLPIGTGDNSLRANG